MHPYVTFTKGNPKLCRSDEEHTFDYTSHTENNGVIVFKDKCIYCAAKREFTRNETKKLRKKMRQIGNSSMFNLGLTFW